MTIHPPRSKPEAENLICQSEKHSKGGDKKKSTKFIRLVWALLFSKQSHAVFIAVLTVSKGKQEYKELC